MYTAFMLSDLLSKVSLTSDGTYLHIDGEIHTGSVIRRVNALVPVLALTSFSLPAHTGDRFNIEFTIWDGATLRVGPFTEPVAISRQQLALDLSGEVWALNQRWPMSEDRAKMVRKQAVAAGFDASMTGPIGAREFDTKVDFENDAAKSAWFAVAPAHPNALGMERATFASGAGYIMLTGPEVILVKPSLSGFDFVAMPYDTVSAIRLSESDRPGWLKMAIDASGKRHELAIGWALDPNNPLDTWSVFGQVPLKSADAANFLTSRLYRYLLKCWSMHYPTDAVSVSKLHENFAKGTLAPEAYSTLLHGIEHREGYEGSISYPLDEPQYK